MKKEEKLWVDEGWPDNIVIHHIEVGEVWTPKGVKKAPAPKAKEKKVKRK